MDQSQLVPIGGLKLIGANGKTLHVATIRRWIQKGCRGVRLRAVKRGSVWLTCWEWIENFQQELTRRALQTDDTRPNGNGLTLARERLRREFGI